MESYQSQVPLCTVELLVLSRFHLNSVPLSYDNTRSMGMTMILYVSRVPQTPPNQGPWDINDFRSL